MEFSKTDIKIVVVSAIALLLISATASATPIDDGFGEMPEFENTAEMNLDVPDQPGKEVWDSGILKTGPGVPSHEQEDKIIANDDIEVNLIATGYNPPNDTDVNVALEFTNKTSGNTTIDNEVLNESESTQLETNDTAVTVEYTRNTSEYASIEWKLENYPDLSSDSDENGGIVAGLQNIASWIGYIAELFAFALDALLSGMNFVFTAIGDVFSFVIDIITWLTDGYGSIISDSPDWAKPFVSIPALLLGLEFMKLIMIIVNLVWIG